MMVISLFTASLYVLNAIIRTNRTSNISLCNTLRVRNDGLLSKIQLVILLRIYCCRINTGCIGLEIFDYQPGRVDGETCKIRA